MIKKPAYIDRSAYYTMYTDLATDSDLMESFKTSSDAMIEILDSISEEKLQKKYGDDKWTVAQLLLHTIDSERILSYRALAIARGEENRIQGYEENIYAANDYSSSRTLSSLKEEFLIVRKSTVSLIQNIHEDALHREGNANGLIVTPCVLGWMICGHTLHHLKILRERYDLNL